MVGVVRVVRIVASGQGSRRRLMRLDESPELGELAQEMAPGKLTTQKTGPERGVANRLRMSPITESKNLQMERPSVIERLAGA